MFSAVPLLVAVSLNALFASGPKGQISLVTYGAGLIMPLITGFQILAATIDVFVPLVSPSSFLCAGKLGLT